MPGRKIVQEWQTGEWPKDYDLSILEIALSKKDGGTELAMTHSRVPAEQADECRKGWIDYYWDPLKRHFATT